jgi:hypothetical protein
MILVINQLSRNAKPLGSPQSLSRDMSHAVASQAKQAINKTKLTMA